MFPYGSLGLKQGVGEGMPNLPEDVDVVLRLINRWAAALGMPHTFSSSQPQAVKKAIANFQTKVVGQKMPTGKIVPGDLTAEKLKMPPPGDIPLRPPVGTLPTNPPQWTPLQLPAPISTAELSKADYDTAAKAIGCETRMIHALGLQEGHGAGFDKYNRPTFLFEPTHFRKLSGHAKQYAVLFPDLTHLQPKPHPYGKSNEQWNRMQRAYLLNARAALMAPSWGKYQILGQNYKMCGYESPEAFVTAMCQSEQAQLTALVGYCKGANIQKAMADKDWQAIATGYNGANWRTQFVPKGGLPYDKSLEKHYNDLKD